MTVITHSEADTSAIGRELAVQLSPGSVVLLVGDLGAGKTAFVRGLAEGLGVAAEDVSSPTFTLMQEYRGGRMPLLHVDLYRLTDPREIDDPNVVKVVTDRFENAIYFSRSTIPYVREKSPAASKGKREEERIHYKHVGLYVYQRDFLLQYPDLPVGPLEKAERLEQLRALENGHTIRVVETDYESLGVDTPEDLERVAKLFETSLAGVNLNG